MPPEIKTSSLAHLNTYSTHATVLRSTFIESEVCLPMPSPSLYPCLSMTQCNQKTIL